MPWMTDLYVSDLDGTLLRSDATLSSYTRTELSGLLAHGMHFTVATARALPAIKTLLKGLYIQLPVIELNGALLTDLNTGRHLQVHPLDATAATSVLDAFVQLGLLPFIASACNGQTPLWYAELHNSAMQWYLDEKLAKDDPRPRRTNDLSSGLAGNVLAITLLDREDVVHVAREIALKVGGGRVRTQCFEHPYCEGFWELSVHDASASKATAIAALRQASASRYERLTVFGDSTNDLDMFKVADRAVAVNNAVPEERQAATELTHSNDEDGVVRWLRMNAMGTKGGGKE